VAAHVPHIIDCRNGAFVSDERQIRQGDDQARLTGAQARWLMFGLRYAMPTAIVIGGGIVMALGSETDLEGGAGIVGAGLATYLMNWLYRASIDGDRVRQEEEAARAYFDLHGHWPDETTGSRAPFTGSGRRPAQAARVGAARGPAAGPGRGMAAGATHGMDGETAPIEHAAPVRALSAAAARRRRDHG
jgi:hypothetical protein